MRNHLFLLSTLFASPVPIFAQDVLNAMEASSITLSLNQPLERPFRADNEDINRILTALARTYKFTVAIDKDVTGKASLEVHSGTVRDVIDTLTEPNGFFYEERSRFLAIKRMRTVPYIVEYSKAQRTAQSTSSVNLSTASSNTSSEASSGGAVQTSTGTGSGAGNGNGGQNGGASNVTIGTQNDNAAWEDLNATLQAMKEPDEKIVINSFSGIVNVTASVFRQNAYAEFLATFNRRANRQVEIQAQFVEVAVNDSFKFGVDYTQAATKAGIQINSITAPTDIVSVEGQALAPNTFVGSFSAGKLTAMVRALEDQGTVNSLSVPRITVMHNSTGLLNVSDSITIFSLASSTTNSTSTSTSPFTSTVETYSRQSQSFGTFLPITVHISDDGFATLTLEPRRSRLTSITSSPDGKQNGANIGEQNASTQVRVRIGQTVILGGLIKEERATSQRGIPVLKDIPAVGKLFRTDAKSNEKSELTLIITVNEPTSLSTSPAVTGAPAPSVAPTEKTVTPAKADQPGTGAKTVI
jgi:type II secretory pathway component GspD/PulD (secretin)